MPGAPQAFFNYPIAETERGCAEKHYTFAFSFPLRSLREPKKGPPFQASPSLSVQN
jgi:hypothetical protein